MKNYAYFPGCCSCCSCAALGISNPAIMEPLEIGLIELEDWNCCGATPYNAVNKLEATCVAARNLAIAEKTGLDLVTSCSNCYIVLYEADANLKEYPALREQVREALAAGDMEYHGGVRVRHLVEVLYNDITPEAIAAKVTNPLKGLKVAPYYGCQLVRPIVSFDDPESPHSLDEIVTSLGAETVSWPLKERCCGGTTIMSEPDVALELVNKLLESAQENGAECLVTPCPLCHINLDAYQSAVNSRFKTKYNLPILFVTQLIGLATGVKPQVLGLTKHSVSPMKVLAPYL